MSGFTTTCNVKLPQKQVNLFIPALTQPFLDQANNVL